VTRPGRVVVALGGNAILQRGERGTAAEQRAAVREACETLAALAADGRELVVTHGNGPQVGRLMILNRAAPPGLATMPLDVLVAESQGQIGYVVQQELSAALRRVREPRTVLTLLTQVVVDPADPAFLRPTKPVGPHLSEEEARRLRASGAAVSRQPNGGWRRLVPSPRPLEIVEERAVEACVDAGFVPVAAGGGGIPVVREGNALRGVEAVVDKDLAAALLVRAVGAGLLLILTDVSGVARGFGTPAERLLDRLSVGEAKDGVASGEFSPGSMGPKVEAAVQAVEAGARAIITSYEAAGEALEGRAGTEVVP
jgi:carbamate kinase